MTGVTEARTDVHPEPSLAQRIQSARDDFLGVQRQLDQLGAEGRTRAWASKRQMAFLEGEVKWLKGETADGIAALSEGASAAVPESKQVLEAKVASKMRWDAVRTLVRMQEQQRRAEKLKAVRKSAVLKQQEAAAREMLTTLLLDTAAATLPELPWRGEGCIDLRYNLGLPAEGAKRPLPLAVSTGGTVTFGAQVLPPRPPAPGKPIQLCYYCAGGLGGSHRPISASHPMWACPLRLRCGVREFPPLSLARVREGLETEAAVLRRAITSHATATVEAKLARKGSFQLSGVASVIANARTRHLPHGGEGPPPSPPPSEHDPAARAGYLYTTMHELRWEQRFWRKALVCHVASLARVSGFARLADFKGLAVLQAPDHDPAAPLTPAAVLDACDEIGLLPGLVGSPSGLGSPPPGKPPISAPFRAIWLAAEFLLAPLPALWRAVPPADGAADGFAGGRRTYEKTLAGDVFTSDAHPLRDAYHTTARRFIRYCPQLSLKQRPQYAWHLFEIDGQPLCVDMRAAAKRRSRYGPRWQQVHVQKLQQRGNEGGAAPAAARSASPSAPPRGRRKGSLRWTNAGGTLSSVQLLAAGPFRGKPLSPADASGSSRPPVSPDALSSTPKWSRPKLLEIDAPEAVGLEIVRFPPLQANTSSFAPPPAIEPVAARLAEAARASIHHAADESLAALREAGTADGAAERATCVLAHIDDLRLDFDHMRTLALRHAPRCLDEVLVMANYLCLRYGGDAGSDQLWIADAALSISTSQLGWGDYLAENGTRYYVNGLTGETVWENPQLSFLRGVAQAFNDAANVLYPRAANA